MSPNAPVAQRVLGFRYARDVLIVNVYFRLRDRQFKFVHIATEVMFYNELFTSHAVKKKKHLTNLYKVFSFIDSSEQSGF